MKAADLYSVCLSLTVEEPDEDDPYKTVDDDRIASFTVTVPLGSGISVAAVAAEEASKLWRERYESSEDVAVKKFKVLGIELSEMCFSSM